MWCYQSQDPILSRNLHLSRLLPDTSEQILWLLLNSAALPPFHPHRLHLHLSRLFLFETAVLEGVGNNHLGCQRHHTVRNCFTWIAHRFSPEPTVSPLGALKSLCEVSTSTVGLIIVFTFLILLGSKFGFWAPRLWLQVNNPLSLLGFVTMLFPARGEVKHCPPDPSLGLHLYSARRPQTRSLEVLPV